MGLGQRLSEAKGAIANRQLGRYHQNAALDVLKQIEPRRSLSRNPSWIAMPVPTEKTSWGDLKASIR